MKKLCYVIITFFLMLMPMQVLAADVPADGEYTVEVTLSGGSGKATVESPARLLVEQRQMRAVVVWSSANYTYMLVDGVQYNPINTEGNSTFEIPVSALDTELAVSAETVAMSEPHVIEYTLRFDAATLKSQNGGGPPTAVLVVVVAAAVAIVCAVVLRRTGQRGQKN